jgi:hypothetical protein
MTGRTTAVSAGPVRRRDTRILLVPAGGTGIRTNLGFGPSYGDVWLQMELGGVSGDEEMKGEDHRLGCGRGMESLN